MVPRNQARKAATISKSAHQFLEGLTNTCPGYIPVLKVPSGMKKAPTVMPTNTRNLKNQKLRGKHKGIPGMFRTTTYTCINTILEVQCTCLAAREQRSLVVQRCGDKAAVQTHFGWGPGGPCCCALGSWWGRRGRRSRPWRSTCGTLTCSLRWCRSSPCSLCQVWSCRLYRNPGSDDVKTHKIKITSGRQARIKLSQMDCLEYFSNKWLIPLAFLEDKQQQTIQVSCPAGLQYYCCWVTA